MRKKETMMRVLIEAIVAFFALLSGGMIIAFQGPRGTDKSAIYEWDFAVDGGLVGDINLRLIAGEGPIPTNSLVEGKDIIVDVLTLLTGGASATAALKLESAADVQAAAAVTGAPWSTTGPKDPTLEGFLKTAGGALRLTVGTAALTAGKIRVYIPYETLS